VSAWPRWTLALALPLAACGPSAKPRPAPHVDELAPPIVAPVAAEAEVTFAVFHPTPPRDVDRAVRLRLRSPPPALAPFLADAGAPPEGLSIRTVPNDDTLPLRREVLVAEAGALGPQLESARAVTLVHAGGKPGGHQGLLRWTAWAAVLAADNDGVVVDLATWKAANAKDFQQQLTEPTWLEAQVVPSMWAETPELLGFATRGMAKLGLPDVEWGGVPRAEGRTAFDALMAVVADVRGRGHGAVGEQSGRFVLVDCERPREAYTLTCVRLKPAP